MRLPAASAALVLLLSAVTSPAAAANRPPVAADTARTVSAAPTAGPAPPAPAGTLRLAAQSNWVDPTKDKTFDLQVQATAAAPPDQVLLVVDVLVRVTTRSELARSFAADYQSYFQAGGVVSSPLAALKPDETGTVDMKLPIASLHLSRAGIYPISVVLRPRGGGAPIARFVTHLLASSPPTNSDKLDVAWIAPIYSPPATAAEPITVTQDAHLTALINSLSVHPKVPATLAPNPDTLDALGGIDPAVVSRLGRSLSGREVLGSTWVPTPIASMISAGLGDQVSLSLTRGTDTLSSRLGTSVTGPDWVFDGPVDQDSLSFLRGAQFDRVVLPEADLDPNPFRFTLAQPFDVAGQDRTRVRAAVADAGLAAHFNDQPDQVLAAHQLLADLTQIYDDAPANTRGVVVAAPRGWNPSGAFLEAWMSALESSPVLNPVTLGGFFAGVPPAVGTGAQPLLRGLVIHPDVIRSTAVGLLASDQRTARDQLEALASALPIDTSVYPRLERSLLVTPSADLSPGERRARLEALGASIRAETNLITLPGARTITLTERKGRLPITIVSQSDEPVRIMLRVQSDKLRFPVTQTSGTAIFTEDLHKGSNLLDLLVEARSAGAFPLRITVMSPRGGLVFQQTVFTVQSHALSGVGVVLSVGAAIFLMIWWGRHAWRSRSPVTRRHARHPVATQS